MSHEIATFAMGCFWQPDYVFSKITGVMKVVVGYTGCKAGCANPRYDDVCSGKSGCAEAVEITFDSNKITYDALLDVFWTHHDPTQMNRQGPDEGTQYRSAIFYHSEEQKKQALASVAKWKKQLIDPSLKIVTEITKAGAFYPAEQYHQQYLMKTGRVCHLSRRVFR